MPYQSLNNLSSLNGLGTQGVGSTSTPFNPNSIAGLTLWFKANTQVYSDAGTTPATDGQTVQQWNDQSASTQNLSGTGTAKPTFNTNVKNGLPIITFNGTTNRLSVGGFTLNQPEHVFMMWRQPTWADAASVYDGASGYNTMRFLQDTTSPNVSMYAGNALITLTTLATNTFGITDTIFNGASSSVRLNNGTKVTGNAGASNAGGFVLGSDGGSVHFANIGVGEVLIYNAALSDANATLVINYLNSKWAVF